MWITDKMRKGIIRFLDQDWTLVDLNWTLIHYAVIAKPFCDPEEELPHCIKI